MPMGDIKMSSRWADEVESEEDGFTTEFSEPVSDVEVRNDERIVTEIRVDPETGQKIKITRTYKLIKRWITQAEKDRRGWKKFGTAKNDGRGPNYTTTMIADETKMHFLNKNMNSSEDSTDKKSKPPTVVRCRYCNGSHFSAKCLYKESSVANISEPSSNANTQTRTDYTQVNLETSSAAYVRPGADRTIRVSNLPTTMTDTDLMDLCGPFGKIERVYLAKDKTTLECYGYAYVTYALKDNCFRAIQSLNGYGYDHLIIKVDWSKPTY